jgi:23S rRNA (cytidine1920-2'-O)/16S rRNA (cytidine1409-2'-O)-methyltransferase
VERSSVSKKPKKLRADLLTVEHGLAESSTRAQALILAGKIYSGERQIQKPGDLIRQDVELTLKGKDHPWVSRGGTKLTHALDIFEINVSHMTVLDVGTSTGGFTDVVLSNGADKVYAVDVGHGQLAWALRNDPRVIVLERTNARYLTIEQVPQPIDIIVCDASFISLELVLSAALSLTKPSAWLVALIKPQFEVGKSFVGKGGVVRDPHLHEEVCHKVKSWISAQPGWHVIGITQSPIKGPAGNTEFLIAAKCDLLTVDS